MSAAMLTADWFDVGRDVYFRKFEIYSMAWQNEVNLDKCIVAAAPYAGPIAVRRDDKKIVRVQGSGQPVISIFSSSGKFMSSIKWRKRPIVHMGWSNDEELVVLTDDGMVVLHDMFGKFQHEFIVTKKLQDCKVVDARIYTNAENSTGVAVMTANYSFFLIHNIYHPKARQLSDLPRANCEPSNWIVIAEKSYTEILVSRGMELYRLKQDEQHISTALEPDMNNKSTGILEMAVSLNAAHLALFTDSGCLWLGSTNLRSKYCEMDTGHIYRPKQLVWCGTEAVIAYWEQDNSILVVGRDGNNFTYYSDSPVTFSVEIDGVRILSATQHELLQKVPDVVQKIFRINSTQPGSYLLEASKQFQKRSHRANEYLSLVNDLELAVKQCIEAVGYEFDTDVQKMLIRAAQFGKCFVSTMNPDTYVDRCRLLRVLNEIRNEDIAIPLTIEELHYLGYKALLDRLVTRKHYYLAILIAKYLNMSDKDGSSRILVQWAKYKVSQSQLEEETVAREIADKLGYTPGISYSDIANTAAECGKKKLAIKLLDYELKASKQVSLLLKLSENTRESTAALVKAIESGDTDLVYTVILTLHDKMSMGDFKMTIRNYPVAQALYIKYCKENVTQALKEIYVQEDDFISQAKLSIMESIDPKEPLATDALLNKATEYFKKARNELCASMCDEALKLRKHQRDLEDKLKHSFANKSIHDTCFELLKINELKLAEKFKNEYKIPDKRYWWLRIQALAIQEEWTELEKFSKLKKSPIGYAPFVDVCLKMDNRFEASKYLSRVNEDIKVKYYIKAEKLEEAAQIAFEQRDVQGLLSVQNKCSPKSSLSEKINGYISQLEIKK